MLKYLDIARLVGAGLACTACKSTRCHRSRWASKEEKLGSGGLQPFRCDDCQTRFLGRQGAALERYLVNGFAAVALVFGVFVILEIHFDNMDAPASEGATPVQSRKLTSNMESGYVEQTMDLKSDRVLSSTPEDQENADKPGNAIKALKAAADDGDAGAMVQLSQLLLVGESVPKDIAQAAKWMQLAAATGHVDGMIGLGRYYRDGIGLPQSAVRAYVWLSHASAVHNPEAVRERDELIKLMSKEELKEAQSQTLPAQEAIKQRLKKPSA